MKYKIYGLCIVWLCCLTSCTSYYYSTLNSNSRQMIKSDNGDFVIENDTVIIVYNFYGENAPFTISVHNKVNQPLYVDWSKSAVIIDGVATTYKEAKYSMEGQSAEFIPPHSQIFYTPLELTNFPFNKIPDNQYHQTRFCKNDGKIVNIKKSNFSYDDSPLAFRSYLTIYNENKPSEPLVFNHEFYVSEMIKTRSVSPDDFAEKKGDTFYMKEVKGSTAAGIATIVILNVANIALDSYINSKYYE